MTYAHNTHRIAYVNTHCIDTVGIVRSMDAEKPERLKKARAKMYRSAQEAAETFGWKVAGYRHHENGTRDFDADQAKKYARAFRVSAAWLLGLTNEDDDDEQFLVPGPTLFIKGEVRGGYFAEAWEVQEDEWERYTGRADISAPARKRFGLRVVGDSMNEVYPPGTILDCVSRDPFDEIPNGKRVIVRRKRLGDGIETTVKEYFRDEAGIEWLVPRSRNPAFQAPFRCDQPGEDIEAIEVIAIVVASIQPE